MFRRNNYGRSTSGLTPLSIAVLLAGSAVLNPVALATQSQQKTQIETEAGDSAPSDDSVSSQNPNSLIKFKETEESTPDANQVETTPTKPDNKKSYSIWEDKLFYGLIIFALGHVLVPTWRYYWARHVQRTNYMRWLRAGVDSSLSRYGEPVSDELLTAHDNLSSLHHNWYKNFSGKDYPVPSMLLDLHSAHQKCRERIAEESPYVPYFMFVVNDDRKMDHDHPIWLMNKARSNVVTRYLTSQAQIKSSLKDTYSSPLYDLITHDDIAKREQWAHSFEYLLEDACENYIATIELHRSLNEWGFKSEGNAALLFDNSNAVADSLSNKS